MHIALEKQKFTISLSLISLKHTQSNYLTMQKRIYIFCLALSAMCLSLKSFAQKGRSEIAIGYGYYSIYSLVNGVPYSTSSGTPTITYRYYLTKDVTLGLALGSENINNWGSFTTITPELTVAYMDTRHAAVRVRLYGSISYGVTIFNDNNVQPGQADQSGLWAYGFQATPLGIRLGRQVALFAEVGLGYKGLFHAGVDFRFPRVLAKNRYHED